MKRADIVLRRCRQVLTCQGVAPKRGGDLANVGLQENVSLAIGEGKIIYLGPDEDLFATVATGSATEILEAENLIVLPGFIDSHTHLPFAGSREEEFALRLQGYTYQELAARGLGIQTTVKATREIPEDKLLELCLARCDSMLLHGTTTAEAKSGYGLNLADEIKQLEVIRQANQIHPLDILPTYLGAHEVPPEYKGNKKAYLNFMINKVLPVIKEKNLARFVDVFCEEGVYDLEETRFIIRAAKKMGLAPRIHADEFSPLGGARLAVEEEALSADHLLAIDDQGIALLAQSSTVATFLPVVSLFLMQEKKAPARELIQAGAVVAIASDFNPGSSMTENMLLVIQLAVLLLKMKIEEAINAATINAAFSLGISQACGSLEVGKKADLILCDIPNYLHLVYHLGVNPIYHVIKNGRWVVRERKLVYLRPSNF
ncbi:MAG: imidazolonepropionase [Candidatus Aminicenantes bacterium 4484_214]|nr:MAG: imidazolonepropionase [Candidatus Aminicenantes bacterium 4484_214]RLE09563.1 MAG: imidazolonepropionase [Candidatus Aminicenantes bacterium]